MTRPIIMRELMLPDGGAQAVAQGMAFALNGAAMATANAQAISTMPGFGQLSFPAQAVATSCAQSLWGSSMANAMATAQGFDPVAVAQSMANTFNVSIGWLRRRGRLCALVDGAPARLPRLCCSCFRSNHASRLL